jgi:general secretion pathway protein M
MKAWLESLGRREQLMVFAAAAAVLLLLLYTLLWSPLYDGYSRMRDNVVAQRETAQWMEQSAQRLQQLQQSRGPATGALGEQSMLALADSSARAQGLADALKRVEPEGSSNVKVWLENASFDTVLQWLGGLQARYGIRADTVSMERVSGVAGRINARMTLQAPEL